MNQVTKIVGDRIHIDTDTRRWMEARGGLFIVVAFCGTFWGSVIHFVL